MNAPHHADYPDPIAFLEALGNHFLKAPTLNDDTLDEIAKTPPSEIIDTFNNIITKMMEAGQDLVKVAADLRKKLAPPTVDDAHGHTVGQYVKRVGKLVRIEKITPKPLPYTLDFIFEERLARVELRRNGKVIRDERTYGDYYGEGTGEESAIEAATEMANEQEITKESEVELVVVRVVSQCRCNYNQNKAAEPKIFMGPYFEAKSIGAKYDVAEDVETDVWSTKRGTIAT
jgi:hypothetical protein